MIGLSEVQMQRKRVVVVGAGIAGLAAAIRAAGDGANVTVLERAANPGGRARTQVRDGFSLNLGPHALYAQGELMSLLRRSKIEIAGRKPPTSGWLSRGEALHPMPGDPWSFLTTGALSGAADRAALAWRLAATARPAAWAGRSVAEWAGDDRAGAAIQALVRVSSYANAPDRQDAGAALQQLRRALVGGVLYLDGGWGRIVAGMARRAAELGAEFRYGEGAEEIAAGEVRTERATYAADRIVVALPALGAANLLAARFPAEAAQIQALEPVRAACLDLCLSALPRPDRRFVLGLDRADYLSVHSGVADLAPPGGAVIHAARYLGADKADAAVRQELEALLDRAQPGWRSAVVHARWAPELEVCGALDRIDRPRPPIQPPALAAAGIACAGDYVASPGMLADAAADTGWRAGAC